jgi:putative oxidoreductase
LKLLLVPKDVAGYGGIFAVAPAFFAWMGALLEAIGGLLLLIGFQTRLASFLIMCTMLVAILCNKLIMVYGTALPQWVSMGSYFSTSY